MSELTQHEVLQGVSIIIPTYKRPHGIATALPSVERQLVDGHAVQIIVADNDPAASARAYVADFANSSDAAIQYVHVPNPGVANARNGAMAAATGRYILFLDDDMEVVAEDWAAEMIKTSKTFEAGLVFGPITATVPDPSNALQAMMVPIYSREMASKDTYLDDAFGTGNSLIDRQLCTLPDPVFNPALNQVGGEDDCLFDFLISQGAKMSWCEAAKTLEHVPVSRANKRYVWQRNFSWGQTPTKAAADRGIRGLPAIVFWMMVGFAQSAVYGAIMILLRVLGRPNYIRYYARFAQGIGKVFWSHRLTPKLYGN